MAEPEQPRHRPLSPTRSIETAILRSTAMIAAFLLLFAALLWLIDLEHRLPDVRAPRDFQSSEILPGEEIISPGYQSIDEVDPELSGDWLMQEIGEADWVATDEPGSQLRAVFYGTDVYLVARIGPEAGLAYVEIDGSPVENLNEDEQGTYSDLWASEASDQPILLVSGLAHGEHLIEITAGGEGEVAISGFDVIAETPFAWAFLLAYIGIGGGIFMLIRQLLHAISGRHRDAERPDNGADMDAIPS